MYFNKIVRCSFLCCKFTNYLVSIGGKFIKKEGYFCCFIRFLLPLQTNSLIYENESIHTYHIVHPVVCH